MNAIATATPATGPPPLTINMILGIMNQPATTTTMMIAEAIIAPRRSSLSRVKARIRHPARW